MKRETLKSKRENELYTVALQLEGNGKLVDYDNSETGERFRYAQVNVPAITCCPFRSAGCESVCYATKGNHVFPSVKKSRERSFAETKLPNFSEKLIYTINTEMESKRYKGNIMLVRVHESGDFYSIQYLRKWVTVWHEFSGNKNIHFTLYTKSFPFFLMLNEQETAIINTAMKRGTLSINLSLDDTTSPEQLKAYWKMKEKFPLCNTYYCTEYVSKLRYDVVCECANCAKCATCNKAQGTYTAVKIHSASNEDMKKYRKNSRA